MFIELRFLFAKKQFFGWVRYGGVEVWSCSFEAPQEKSWCTSTEGCMNCSNMPLDPPPPTRRGCGVDHANQLGLKGRIWRHKCSLGGCATRAEYRYSGCTPFGASEGKKMTKSVDDYSVFHTRSKASCLVVCWRRSVLCADVQ